MFEIKSLFLDSSFWAGYGIFSGRPGVEWCLSDLFLDYGVPIAFVLRSSVRF